MKAHKLSVRQPKTRQQHHLSLIVGLLIVFLVSLKLLSACSAESVTLSLLVPHPEAQFWRSPIEEFENKYPKIRINLKNFDNSQVEKPEDTNQLRAI
ncbi:MAG: hypothetical protein HC820_07630, partial [Hydrococcus sp. RM1_1_31]|nr:hypothetical protein [Hydrococcus sp. RM1_1_31]